VFQNRDEDLFIIDLNSSTIKSTTCEWNLDAIYNYTHKEGYSLIGLFHTHPDSSLPYASGIDLFSLRNSNATYLDVIVKDNTIYRYNRCLSSNVNGNISQIHPIIRGVITSEGIKYIYRQNEILKY